MPELLPTLMLFTRKPEARVLLHALFWTLYIGFFTMVLGSSMPWIEALPKVSIVGATYAAFVYLNLRWGIPRLLWHSRYGAYALFIVGTSLACGVAVWQVLALLDRFGNPIIGEEFALPATIFNAVFMLFITSSAKLLLHSVEQQQANRHLENQQLQTEIDFLKSQVNPHFLFNTLNNLYALALTKDDRAPEIVLKLSAILRYMLYECNERLVFLNKEIAYLRNYIELEELRQDGRNKIQLSISGITDRLQIAPLLFTPLLENAIKHGLNRTAGKAWVELDLRIRDQSMHFTIANSKGPARAGLPRMPAVAADETNPKQQTSAGQQGTTAFPDGTGRLLSHTGTERMVGGSQSKPIGSHNKLSESKENQTKATGGIGLLNVKRRLDLLYPDRHTFRISESAETYTVHLTIKLGE